MSTETPSNTLPKLIQITPLPNNKLLDDTTTDVTGIPYDTNNPKYNQNGTYIATSSSYANPENKVFNIFNGSASVPWSCNFSNNSDYDDTTFPQSKYLRDPYTGSSPSKYQGGGQTSSRYGTLVGKETIYGEWIQLQLPYHIYLFRYNIVIPTSTSTSFYFPKKFMLVGSNDGNTWDYVHQKDFTNDKLKNKGNSIEYNINSPDKYCYFRLIISELVDKQSIINIKQWNMFGTVEPTINNEAFTNKPSSPTAYPFIKSEGNYIEYNDPSYFMKKIEPFTPFYVETAHGAGVFNEKKYREGLDNPSIDSIRNNENRLQTNSANNAILQQAINNQYYELQKNNNSFINDQKQYLKTAFDNGADTIHPKPRLIDGKKEDAKDLMNQENSILTLGFICSSILIVFAIVTARGNQ